MEADLALENISAIYTEFGEFVQRRGTVSEADTRVKVVDSILKGALGWAESDIRREEPISQGYIDYVLYRSGRAALVIEAKRQGVAFDVPRFQQRSNRHKLNGALRTATELYKAIEQAQRYCSERGIRFAVVTNGYAWVVFRGHREDIPWREGYSIIFPSAGYIKTNFNDFWNLLSRDAVMNGSLENAFTPTLLQPKPQYRVLARLRDPDAPLWRNSLHQPLVTFVETVFRDIAEPDQEELLRSCYVYSRNLQTIDSDLQMILQDAIPRFVQQDAAESVEFRESDAGDFGRGVITAAGESVGSVFLLLGGIGSGKTTFLKRFFNFVGREALRDATLWFYLDLRSAPVDPADIGSFVAGAILRELRGRYGSLQLETRDYICEAYAQEIRVLHQSVLRRTSLGDPEYEKRLSTRIERWMEDAQDYVAHLLRAVWRQGRGVVLCIDNVDQLPPAYQAEIFLLAQRLAQDLQSVTIVALREESYYSASIQRAFTAYNNRKFHIASPSFLTLLKYRMDYVEQLWQLSSKERKLRLKSVVFMDDPSIARFFNIVRQSIFESNRNIARCVEALAFRNMREALEMFSTFLYSGATDVNKMLAIAEREGNYYVSYHEFIKAIILGDRRHYKDSSSRILNVFDRGAEGLSSHFSALRILKVLLSQVQNQSPEGRGFLPLESVIRIFADVFGDEHDVIFALERLVRRQLVEVDTRSTQNLTGASWVRVTSAGWYYERYLCKAFAYLDLMLEDTAFDEASLVDQILSVSREVDAIAESATDRLKKTELRFQRVDAFLAYLVEREQMERATFDLDQRSDTLSTPIMNDISAQYTSEKAYIRDRLRQKQENRPEELPHISTPLDPDSELTAVLAAQDSARDPEDETEPDLTAVRWPLT